MDFELNEDRSMMRDSIRRFLSETYDIKTRHAAADSDDGFSRETWGKLVDLGVIGALLPETVDGGFGGRGSDIAVVFEELGRHLVVEPALATAVLGASVILEAGGPDQVEMLNGVAAGEVLLCFAHGEPDSRYATAHVASRAVKADDGWRIDGRKAVVLNGDTADKLIVSARLTGDVTDATGIGLFVVDGDAPGLTRRGVATIDGGRAAEITLDGVALPASAMLSASADNALPAIETALARATLAVCAEAIGIMDVMQETTLDYVKTRTQFGRAIGAFQVLQHRLVDVALEIEQARSAVMLAASQLESADLHARDRSVSAAKHLIGRVGRLVAEEAIQIHGGIAMTWDYPLAHYAKRLVMIDHLFGDEDEHLARFATASRNAAA